LPSIIQKQNPEPFIGKDFSNEDSCLQIVDKPIEKEIKNYQY